ncbi:MAG: HAD family phosphatase [Pseudomonadota bacterium]
MCKFEMVIFDCDGVLVDSEPLTNLVMQRSLAAHGLDLSLDDIMRLFVGGTIAGVADKAREMGATLTDDWVEHVYAEMFEVLGREVEAIPGAAAVLDALDAAGIPYAVGSNGPHRKMEITLARTGMLARLQGRIYSREDVPNPKPAPDVYLKAARDAGIALERCVVIEDSVSGARAGKAAGMTVFGFAAETPAERLVAICDSLFDDMGALPRLLGH